MSRDADFETRYLSGRELFGDDFTQDQIDAWFETEREGYANLGSAADDGGGPGAYSYHALNEWHGFRHLPAKRRFHRALGLGSAYGGEFQPVADRIDELTILEPSDQLVGGQVGRLVPRYVKPDPSGTMPFPDETFDLFLCLGTLHHIPNVSHVVHEAARVLSRGGWALIREPIVSMGDWRGYRGVGLTMHERGIPRRLLVSYIEQAGLTIHKASYSGFPVTVRLGNRISGSVFSSPLWTRVDSAASRLTLPLNRYHAFNRWQKLRPTSMFVVAHK